MKILIVDDEPNLRRLVEYTLQLEGYEVVTAEDGEEALNKVQTEQPDLAILDVRLPTMSGIEVCQRLRAKSETIDLPIIMLSARAQVSDKIRGLEAGADEYVTKPIDMDELVARVAALLRRRTRPGLKLAPPESISKGQIVVVYGPKGGVGRTVIAVNLAVALIKMTKKRVVLVDGNGQLGDIGLSLGIHSRHTLLDLLIRADELDTELINDVLASHLTGVQVLLASNKVEANEAIQPVPFVKVLTKLQEMFDYSIVDTSFFLSEYMLAVLDIADKIVLVTTSGIPSLRNARAFLDLAGALGYAPGTLLLTLNCYNSKSEIKWQEIEKALKYKLVAKIPTDVALVQRSLDQGVPFAASHSKSPVTQSIFQLAEVIAKTSGESKPATGLWQQVMESLSKPERKSR